MIRWANVVYSVLKGTPKGAKFSYNCLYFGRLAQNTWVKGKRYYLFIYFLKFQLWTLDFIICLGDFVALCSLLVNHNYYGLMIMNNFLYYLCSIYNYGISCDTVVYFISSFTILLYKKLYFIEPKLLQK